MGETGGEGGLHFMHAYIGRSDIAEMDLRLQEERRRVRAERERLERERGPLPIYTSVAKPAETVLASTA